MTREPFAASRFDLRNYGQYIQMDRPLRQRTDETDMERTCLGPREEGTALGTPEELTSVVIESLKKADGPAL